MTRKQSTSNTKPISLWSLIIWRTLILTKRAPDYAWNFRVYERRRAAQFRRSTAQQALNCSYVTGALLLATPCGWIGCFALIPLAANQSLTITLVLMSIFTALVGLGAAILASQIAQAVRRSKQQYTLDHWLMLPHPRHELVLYRIAPAYEPTVFHLGLGITLIIALILGALALDDALGGSSSSESSPIALITLAGWGALMILLLVEWVQWIALSVTVGVLAGSERRLGVPAAIMYGLLVVVVRGTAGLLVAISLGLPGKWFALVIITGPLSGTVATPHNLIGIALGVLYLAGMEWEVGRLFWHAMHQIGEG